MLSDLVRGYAAATLESAERAGRHEQVVEEIAAFTWAVIDNEPLRSALADPALASSARLGVVDDLLRERASAETTALFSFVVRVSPTAEVAGTMTDLRAYAAGAHVHSGVNRPRDFLRGYAERVFQELSDAADLDAVEDELFSFARAVEGNDALRAALGDDVAERRVALARDLLADKVRPETVRLVAAMLGGARVRAVAETLDWLVELVAEERGRRVADVRSAVPLDDAARARLAAALGRLTGRQVEPRVIEDPDIRGGVLVSVGDFMIDATVRLRLERLRDALGATA